MTLTNSALSSSPTPLEKAGIDGFFDNNFNLSDVSAFKPHPATYDMVACHLWDIIGAQAFGCRGGFVARPHNSMLYLQNLPKPDFVAKNLGDLAHQIITANVAI